MQPIPHKAGKYISRKIYGFLDVNPGTTPGRTLLRERKKFFPEPLLSKLVLSHLFKTFFHLKYGQMSILQEQQNTDLSFSREKFSLPEAWLPAVLRSVPGYPSCQFRLLERRKLVTLELITVPVKKLMYPVRWTAGETALRRAPEPPWAGPGGLEIGVNERNWDSSSLVWWSSIKGLFFSLVLWTLRTQAGHGDGTDWFGITGFGRANRETSGRWSKERNMKNDDMKDTFYRPRRSFVHSSFLSSLTSLL